MTELIVIDRQRMQTLRRSRGLSLTALAAEAGLSYPVVWRMEQGGAHGGCRAHSLAAVASALQVRAAELLPLDAATPEPHPHGAVDCPACGHALQVVAR